MRSLILLLVSDIMNQDKKVKKNDIEKLRMILDNPSDPKVRKIVDKHERNLESIRGRLSDETSKTEIKYTASDFLKKSDSLEPRVVIHQKEEKKSIPSEIVSPEPKSYKAEQQQKEEYTDEDDSQSFFDDEDLYEVEKVDVSEPEFLQVKPKEMEKIFEKTTKRTEGKLPIQIPKEKEPMVKVHEKEEKLPEWEPVEEERPDETVTEKAVDEKESVEEMHKKDEVLPDWEPVEEAKSEKVKETVKEKEEPTIKEFTEVTTIDEKIEPQKSLNETEGEIPIWEPVELEKAKEEKEILSEFIEEKPADVTSGEVSEKKVEAPAMAVKESKAELKRKEKELKKKRKDEKKLKKLEEKKEKREAKQKENEAKKAETENKKNLRIKEYEQKKMQKEEEKQKKLEEKKEKKHIGELVVDGEKEKEIVDRSEIKDQKIGAKKAKKEKEVQIKARLKKDKILAASEKKELKKSKKRKKEEKINKVEPKTPELKADKELPIEEKIEEDTATEWESYDMDEIPDTKPDTSAYTHGDFTLYKKEIKTTTGKKRTVHFFSKKTPDIGDAVQLPEGYEVKVNMRTGLPYLKKK